MSEDEAIRALLIGFVAIVAIGWLAVFGVAWWFLPPLMLYYLAR